MRSQSAFRGGLDGSAPTQSDIVDNDVEPTHRFHGTCNRDAWTASSRVTSPGTQMNDPPNFRELLPCPFETGAIDVQPCHHSAFLDEARGDCASDPADGTRHQCTLAGKALAAGGMVGRLRTPASCSLRSHLISAPTALEANHTLAMTGFSMKIAPKARMPAAIGLFRKMLQVAALGHQGLLQRGLEHVAKDHGEQEGRDGVVRLPENVAHDAEHHHDADRERRVRHGIGADRRRPRR